MRTTHDLDVLRAMDSFGGSFARALAAAGYKADDANLAKIRAAFPDLWQEYGELARLAATRHSASLDQER